jgi:SAM-dependent methyltransferase
MTDVYSRTNELDAQTLDVVVDRLEYRATQPIFLKILAEYLDRIGPHTLKDVLDMGCGTGFVARQLGQRKHFHGRVLGVDLSPHLVEAATRLSREEGLSEKVRFSVGDTRSIDLPDASFDAVLPHTLVSHVYDAAAVIREAARVVRPGGVVVVFDGDYGSLTVGTDDPVEGAKMDAAIIASVCASPRVMRAITMQPSRDRAPFDAAIEDAQRELDMQKLLREANSKFGVSCWHINDGESAAMWKLYTAAGSGIAIESTRARLEGALQGDRIIVDQVRYMDFDTDEIEKGHRHYGLFIKRRSFAHEQELRATILLPKPGIGTAVPCDMDALIA